MITEDLISYIQAQRKKNISDADISLKLAKAGWRPADIKEGFEKLTPPPTQEPTPIIQTPVSPQVSVPASVVAPLRTVTPPLQEVSVGMLEIEQEERKESPVVTQPLAPIIPMKVEQPVVPQAIVETQPIELTAGEPVVYVVPEKVIPPVVAPEAPRVEIESKPLPTFSTQSPEQVKPVFEQPELIPTLVPKVTPVVPPSSYTQPLKEDIKEEVPVGLPTSAILTTFSRDIQSSSMAPTFVQPVQKRRTLRMILIILLVLVLAGGITWFVLSGAKLTSFVKKDPKVALRDTPAALSKLTSYTTTVHAMVSFPSIANITNGLVSGDRVTSQDTDSLSIDSVGIVTNSLTTPSLSQYAVNIESSFLKNPLRTDVTHTGNASYIAVPNLAPVFGDKAPAPGVIEVDNNQFDTLLSLIPSTIADTIRTLDVYKIISNGVPPYVRNSMSASVAELIQSASVAEKEPENINNIETYHYQLSMDRPATKKFFGSLVDTFVVTFSDTQKKQISEALGATTIDSFDVWIGKSDQVVYQYSFSLKVPLSKVINLEDKGIAGNQVTLTWQATYSDLNAPHKLSVPAGTTPVNDFVAAHVDESIKDTLSTFKSAALSLRNAEGSFGTRTNPTGSCTNPNPGSLFSPVGHTKGATNSVGTIAGILTNVLTLTNGGGSCFSNQGAWAAAFPLATNGTSSYCVDSAGASKVLTAPLTGTICK